MLKERPKICAECRYARPPAGMILDWICTYDSQNGGISIITGEPLIASESCREMRDGSHKCGPDGKLWMPGPGSQLTNMKRWPISEALPSGRDG